MLDLEMEGMSPEDQELAAARQLVRLAGSAVAEVAAHPDAPDPTAAARQAVARSAQFHAPGLLAAHSPPARPGDGKCGCGGGCGGHRADGGRWEQRGNMIILHDV